MAICYKTLFEVKIFHEYYLTDSDGGNIFDQALQKDRITYLEQRFDKDEASINEELACAIPALAGPMFKGQRLKLLPTYAGFKVVIEVIPQILADGTKTYQPKVTLPDNISIPVLLMKRNSKIEGYTNGPVNRAVNSTFYFSNAEFSGTKVFPFLSNEIPPFNSSFSYQQGDIATHGLADIRAFYRDDTDQAQWLMLNGTAYANENDRLLVPLEFYYSIDSSENVTAADFVIKDARNRIVAEYQFSQADPLERVFISVSESMVLTVPVVASSEDLLYTLEVSSTNGYSRNFNLIFYKAIEKFRDAWALVDIKAQSANSKYKLLDNDGLLLTRRNPDGTYLSLHPVFEIGVRSRLSFWRYINAERKGFQKNLHGDQLVLKAGNLISKVPRALSFTPVFFKKLDNSTYYLPSPKPHQLLRSEGGKLYSDVYVSESNDLFPLGP